MLVKIYVSSNFEVRMIEYIPSSDLSPELEVCSEHIGGGGDEGVG